MPRTLWKIIQMAALFQKISQQELRQLIAALFKLVKPDYFKYKNLYINWCMQWTNEKNAKCPVSESVALMTCTTY